MLLQVSEKSTNTSSNLMCKTDYSDSKNKPFDISVNHQKISDKISSTDEVNNLICLLKLCFISISLEIKKCTFIAKIAVKMKSLQNIGFI